jgi:hypothetical protein
MNHLPFGLRHLSIGIGDSVEDIYHQFEHLRIGMEHLVELLGELIERPGVVLGSLKDLQGSLSTLSLQSEILIDELLDLALFCSRHSAICSGNLRQHRERGNKEHHLNLFLTGYPLVCISLLRRSIIKMPEGSTGDHAERTAEDKTERSSDYFT